MKEPCRPCILPAVGLIKPKQLEKGARVAAVTLSWGGPGQFPHRYRAGKRQLEDLLGVEVVEMPHTLADPAWLAEHPEARARDLMDAFADESIDAVVSTIGGEDSIRLLSHLDLDVLRSHPKILLGYSDTTVLHFACLKAGLVSFYGPSIMAGFGENGGVFPYMARSVQRTLCSTKPVGRLEPNTDGWTVEYLDWADPENQSVKRKLEPSEPWRFLQGEGVHSGRSIGGCLEVVEFLRGTAVWPGPDLWDGAVLFLETSEEAPPPAVLEQALRSYAAMGLLDRLSGILFGRPGGGVPPDEFEAYDRALIRVVSEETGLHSLPIVTRMDFGHTDPMMVLPVGIRVRIDCDKKRIEIPESAVTE